MSSPPSAPNEQTIYARAQAAQAAGRFDEALQLLSQGARAGDTECMGHLGARVPEKPDARTLATTVQA